eukprot:1140541_1
MDTPITGFTLVTPDPPPPHDGGYFFMHYDARNETLWLLNPVTYTSPSWGATRVLQSYNFISNTWTDYTTPDLFKSHVTSFTSIGSILYVIDDAAEFGTLDTATQTILYPHPSISSFYPGTHDPCMANDGRYIFNIGGEDTINQPVREQLWFQIYDTVNSEWLNAIDSNIPLLNIERASSVCEYYEGYLYVFAGSGTQGKQLNSIEMIYTGTGNDVLNTLLSQNWTVLPDVTPPLIKVRHRTSTLCPDGLIFNVTEDAINSILIAHLDENVRIVGTVIDGNTVRAVLSIDGWHGYEQLDRDRITDG